MVDREGLSRPDPVILPDVVEVVDLLEARVLSDLRPGAAPELDLLGDIAQDEGGVLQGLPASEALAELLAELPRTRPSGGEPVVA